MFGWFRYNCILTYRIKGISNFYYLIILFETDFKAQRKPVERWLYHQCITSLNILYRICRIQFPLAE